MFFQVQKMLNAFEVLKTIDGVEQASKILFKEIDFNEDVLDKEAEKNRVLSGLINEKIRGSNGIQEYIERYTSGAMIVSPILYGEHGDLTVEQASVFRLLIEKSSREVESDFEEEKSYRFVDAYSNLVRDGKIADEIKDVTGSAVSDLSDSELEQALKNYSTRDAYYQMQDLYSKIDSNLPVYVELRRAVIGLSTNLEHQDIGYEALKKELANSKLEVKRIIKETLGLDQENSIRLASAFISANTDSSSSVGLSVEAEQIPKRVEDFLNKVSLENEGNEIRQNLRSNSD